MVSPTQRDSLSSGDPRPSDGLVEQTLEEARRQWRQTWQERRAHARYPLGTPFACQLQLDNAHFPPMPVQLLDLSLGGACLLISSLVELRRGEMGELRSPSSGGSGDATGLDGRRLWICWQEARDWITAVGVAFDPPLPSLPQSFSQSLTPLQGQG